MWKQCYNLFRILFDFFFTRGQFSKLNKEPYDTLVNGLRRENINTFVEVVKLLASQDVFSQKKLFKNEVQNQLSSIEK